MTRALLYTRQSVERDEGTNSLSIESQINTLREHCQRQGWHIVGEIREAGLKGWMDADQRPGLAEAIHRAEAGDYDTLLVWDLSRLARSVRLQEQLFWRFAPLGVDIVSVSEPESADALIRQIKGAVNEYRTREIQASVRRAMRTRTANGWHQGRVPWGYVRPKAKAPLVIAPEPDEGIWPVAVVREVFAWRQDGIGPAAIARRLAGRGILTPDGGLWSTSQVMRILRQIAYRGAVRSGDEIIEGAHEAIVPAEVWHAAQCRSGPRRTPRRKAVNSPYEGLIEHVCGQPMYLIQPCGSNPGQAILRCRRASYGVGGALEPPCPHMPRAVPLAQAEVLIWERITEDLKRLRPPRSIIAEAKRAYAHRTAGGSATLRQRAEAQERQALAQRERAAELYVTGAQDRAWFDAQDARALAMLAEARDQLTALPEPPDEGAIAAQWEELRDLRRALRQYGPNERGQVLRVLGVAVVHSADRVTIRYRPGIDAFLRC